MSIKADLSAHASQVFPSVSLIHGAASPGTLKPLHGVFVIGDKPSPELVEAGQLTGELVESLIGVVAQAEGVKASSGRPQIIQPKDYGRDYFRLSVLPPESTIHCSNVDCQRKARVLIDARDEDVLPFCPPCAYVAHSMWMQGI